MKVLVVGSGGREHTLVWKIAQSSLVDQIYAAPGNAGISEQAECMDISQTDIKGLLSFAKKTEIDLTVVGPEAPLAAGIVDVFNSEGLTVFGPTATAAEIESSKAFAKDLMHKYGVPTADYRSFTSYEDALRYVRETGAPIVIKADGLAAGKGSIVAMTEEEAVDALDRIIRKREFGDSGNKVVVEEFMEGEEASVLALTDGSCVIPLAPAQDHKRIFDGDRGPNTGGMGAYAPAPVMTSEIMGKVVDEVLIPTLRGLRSEGRPYKGVLYAGLMFTSDGPKVVEFNCRFGDPESQVVLPLIESDLVDLIMATIEGNLSGMKLEEKDATAVCVVMASKGYPGKYVKGLEITGLDSVKKLPDVMVFHAGTAFDGDSIVTNGGRVLGVTALGSDIKEAVSNVYSGVNMINFEGAYCRKDIAYRALVRLEK